MKLLAVSMTLSDMRSNISNLNEWGSNTSICVTNRYCVRSVHTKILLKTSTIYLHKINYYKIKFPLLVGSMSSTFCGNTLFSQMICCINKYTKLKTTKKANANLTTSIIFWPNKSLLPK